MTPPPYTDPEKPPDALTTDEIEWIRIKRQQDAHEAWLRGRVKVFWPWVVAVIGAVVAVVDWINKHIHFKP